MASPPRLLVGIVVDQMRADYVHRFYSKFSEGGFKRLLRQGFEFQDARYTYVPTYTAPGHASIYTGATPAQHGIIANEWYESSTDAQVTSVQDTTEHTFGGQIKGKGVSPRRLLASTLGDELFLSSVGKANLISISLKDRGAIMPGGHTAKWAFWLDGKSGNFITSSYYQRNLPPNDPSRDSLPAWVAAFNKTRLADRFINTNWNTLMPIANYSESLPDDNPYEEPLEPNGKPVFPYSLSEIYKKDKNSYDVLKETPFGNTLVVEMAKQAIVHERMGKDSITDLLSLSFSATDYIGHQFGVSAVELEDAYIRLDRDLADFLSFLDEKVGKGKYTLFLTADHGAVEVPAYLQDKGIPSGYFDLKGMTDSLRSFLNRNVGPGIFQRYINHQVYLNASGVQASGKSMSVVEDLVADYCIGQSGVHRVYTRHAALAGLPLEGTGAFVQNGFHAARSGNVALVLEPGWTEYSRRGTTHGTPWTYDTRVPLIFFGAGIRPGKTAETVSVVDIAPTCSILLGIPFPNAAVGKALTKAIE